MERVNWQRVLTIELALLAGCALAVVAWLVVQLFLHTLLLLAMATVVAFALAPLVAGVQARVRRRGLAVGIVYLGLGGVIVGGLVLLISPFVQQASALLADLPTYAQQLRAPELEARLRQLGLPMQPGTLQEQASGALVGSGGAVLGGTLAVLSGVTGVVIDLVLVLVLSLYLELDADRIHAALLGLVPPGRRQQARFVEDAVVRIAGGYLRGQLVMALSIGVLAGVGAALFGLRYPVVIGVLAGAFEVIPMFGPVLGALPALLLALAQPFPTVVWVALYFLAIQQVESNILGPRITGHAVGLHPLGALLALLGGFELAGVLGGLFAVPVVGVIWVLASAIYRRLRHGEAEPPAARPGWALPFGRGGGPSARRVAPPADGPGTQGPGRDAA